MGDLPEIHARARRRTYFSRLPPGRWIKATRLKVLLAIFISSTGQRKM